MKQAKRFGFIFGILFLLVAALAFAIPPSTPQSGGLISIEGPKLSYYNAGLDTMDAYSHVFNSTGHTVRAPQVNCTAHIYNHSDQHVLQQLATMEGDDYEWVLGPNITKNPGEYSYVIYCQDGNQAGFVSGTFVMGYTDTDPLFYLGEVLGVIALIAIVLTVGFKLDATHAPIKMFLIWLSFGLVVILTNLLQQISILTIMPALVIEIFTNLFIISVILATVVSFYFMLYFMQMLLKFLQGTAAGKKWWSRKDDKDRS